MKTQFNPLVSIIIPVYNGSNYIKEAIDSALAQTYKNVEIIVVDDGSSDNTEEVVRGYGDRVRYFKKENGGTATALNLGIENMKGEYFSWLSHDDLYYKNKIERQIEELNRLEDKNTIMMSDLDGIDENYQKIYQTNYIAHINAYPPRLRSNIHPVIYNQTHGCTLLIPKACFDKVGLFDVEQRVAHDFEFFYRAFKEFPHKLIPEVLVTARDSSHRQGRSKKPEGNIEYSALFISIIENLSEEDLKLLAPDRLSFYSDMEDFFRAADYTIALDYLKKKYIRNLHISSFDLVGNKFNGYDLHFYLREKEIDAKLAVLYKQSNDPNTFSFRFNDKNATKELMKDSLFYGADIVHLHLIHNILDFNYIPLMTRLKPTILSIDDPFFLSGHCVHHFDCMKWQIHCQDCPYLKVPFVLDYDYTALNFEIKKKAIQDSQIVGIVASTWMKKKLELSPIWQGKKIYLLPYGIDQNIFKPADKAQAKKKLGIPEDSFTVMFRADTGPYKGLEIIKKALSQIENPKKITLITVEKTGLLSVLKDKFKIIENEWITDDRLLSSLYQASDIFLMPSKQEAFGMMAVEAMSCGTPVLALEGLGTAVPDIINSPQVGLAVSEDKFGDELQRLINNPDEIKERSKKSYDYAIKHYSKDIYIKKLVDIYKEVMAEHKPDSSARLILQQLRKYMTVRNEAYFRNTEVPEEKEPFILHKIYRKVPLGIRRPIKEYSLKIARLIKRLIIR